MKNLLSIIVIVGIAATLWWMQSTQRDDLLPRIGADTDGIEAYMAGFTMTAMNEDGEPAIRLHAARLTHYTDSEIAELDTPEIRLLDDSDSGWHITADKGTIDQNGSFVELNTNVNIRSQQAGKPITIDTQSLSIDIDKQRITTEAEVMLVDATTRLRSTGMILDNRTGMLELLADVRGKHVTD